MAYVEYHVIRGADRGYLGEDFNAGRIEMKTRQLGNLTVSEVGMGCMAFSHGYGKIPSEQYSIEAIQNAYRHGSPQASGGFYGSASNGYG